MLWMLNIYYFNPHGISAKQIYSCRRDMQIKQLALVAHFLLALVIPSEYARWCVRMPEPWVLVCGAELGDLNAWILAAALCSLSVCVWVRTHHMCELYSQFRSPVGSLDAKVTGEYWPSDLSFTQAAPRLAKLDSREIISQVCTKTINNRALLASRSPFCTRPALFIEQPRFFYSTTAWRRLLHQIGLWVLDSLT